MTSRLDRLFALLENCSNASLRNAAAEQLGELVQRVPDTTEVILKRLVPLLRSRNWSSRLAAANAIRSIVCHLPPWNPSPSAQSKFGFDSPSNSCGFLGLQELDIDRILAQGARLYSMDTRELESMTTGALCRNSSSYFATAGPESATEVTRTELNSRLGLESDDVISKVMASHSNILPETWISSDDFVGNEHSPQDPYDQTDVNTCMKSVFGLKCEPGLHGSSRGTEPIAKLPRLDHIKSENEDTDSISQQSWPLDSLCTVLLGDLWAKRWEIRHGAASGLRELLSEPRHTEHCGKLVGMTKDEMERFHSRYIEDIAVRVLCTIALDQLSDFISDEVVAPVRETSAQLLGVLCLHLSIDQVLMVAKHLVYLVCLDSDTSDPSKGSEHWRSRWENTWMIVHGGLLGIKYLLAARKDMRDALLQIVTPCLIAQLTSRQMPSTKTSISSAASEEDIRSAAASALIPIVNSAWVHSLGGAQTVLLVDRIWCLLRDTTSDLCSSTGHFLQLISAIILASSDLVSTMKQNKTSMHEDWSTLLSLERVGPQLEILVHLLHHSSSGIRQHTLHTLQHLLDMCFSQTLAIPPLLLRLTIDQLYHRILLESVPAIRKRTTKLCLWIMRSVPLSILAASCVDRLDFWLCQAMQPISVPFPPHLFSFPAVTTVRPSTDAIEHTSEISTGHGHPAPNHITAQLQNEIQFCIGGAKSEEEDYIWETRMCAVKILAYLLSRLCHCYPSNHRMPLTPDTEIVTDNEPSIISYFLDHLLCRLHLKERLAMQRIIGCLVLSYWALLPCPNIDSKNGRSNSTVTWNQLVALSNLTDPAIPMRLHEKLVIELPSLCASLRLRLETCLTEVVYYEEILGSFKLMQEDCRRLINSLAPLGLNQDSLPTSNGVWTISQCSAVLERASQFLSAEPQPDDNPTTSVGCLLIKAQSTVKHCLSLQLLWGSRVEFSVAAAFVCLGWLLPGRLSLLIRPFMDAIRCVQHSEDPVCASPLGSVTEMQCLASFCLARLLHLEWQMIRQNSKHLPGTNPSKAAAKVVKNLSALLLESHDALFTSDAASDTSAPSASVTETDDTGVQRSPSFDSATILPKTNTYTDICAESSSSMNRYRSTSSALAHLCHTFLRNSDSVQPSKEALVNLKCGLPWLWELIWIQPVECVWDILRANTPNIPRPPKSWISVMTASVLASVSESCCAQNEARICISLTALLACLPILYPFLTSDDPDGITFEDICAIAMVTVCLPSSKLHLTGTKLLLSLATRFSVNLYNIVLPIFLTLLKSCGFSVDVRRHSLCRTVMQTLSAIVDAVSSGSLPHLNHELDFMDPLLDFNTGLQEEEQSPSGQDHLPSHVRQFLPFLALLIPPVLRLLPTHDASVRSVAGRLFTALLILIPFEHSVVNPPGMDSQLIKERTQCRLFIESLLHPERIDEYHLPVPFKVQLRRYQQAGVNWLNFLNRFGLNGILCDDLGLGKTLQAICILAASHHHLSGKKPISLVVCPSTLCAHWLCETQQYVSTEYLSPVIYRGDNATRQSLQQTLTEHGLVIASYDVVRRDIQFFQELAWNYVVLDEGHIIKSSKSKVTRAVKNLKAEHRLILTGTPIQNRVSELWSLFDFLMPDFLGSESSFNARFTKPVLSSRDPKASKADQRAGHMALENLHRLVLPFMLRRLKDEVLTDLPPKIIQDFPCDMTVIQNMLYKAFVNTDDGRQLSCIIRSHYGANLSGSGAQISSSDKPYQGFQAFRYLQAICNHPYLVLRPNHPAFEEVQQAMRTEFGSDLPLDSIQLSGKLLGLCRLLTDCGFGTPVFDSAKPDNINADVNTERTLLSQHRVLLFFQTREMLRLTENVLKSHFPWITSMRLDGTVPVKERHVRVVRFNEDPSIDLMLLTTTIGGLGLNLTGADTVIFVEHDWNPTKDLQAMDRAHRIGQKRTVSVYRLITQDSIEQQIMNIQTFKLHLANTVITTENRGLSTMDTGHLFDRFTTTNSNEKQADDQVLDEVERHYEEEYSLEAFVAKLAKRKR